MKFNLSKKVKNIIHTFCKKIFRLSKEDKIAFEKFEDTRIPSMRVIGRGTLTMDIDDAHHARLNKNKIEIDDKIKYNEIND